MKININIFSIPPVISTHWENVKSLRMQDAALIISLSDGEPVSITNLDEPTIQLIFATHAQYLEQQISDKFQQFFPLMGLPQLPIEPNALHRIDIPFRLGGSLEELGSSLLHNPAQSNVSDIPIEILQKIVAITKIISPEGIAVLPKPEPNCNCVHCQIAKVVNKEHDDDQTIELRSPAKEEEVTKEDLHFQQWEIKQTGENLFDVINKLNSHENYHVFLGDPIGCTCGHTGCEHIIAVLKS